MTPFDSVPSLVVISDAGRARQISVPFDGLVLGRDAGLGPPFSTDRYVSRNHVAVRRSGGGVEIADLGSANGTYVNGTPIHAPACLQDSDVLRIGQIELRVAAPGGAPAAEAVPVLTVVAPDAFSGRRFQLSGDYLVVGRDPASGICLDDPCVSWTHAALRRGPDTVYVQDLGSTSGTFVNGQAVTGARQLRPGDVVAFAGVSARLD